jgi:ethanolamine ammonia-lyase large subunit
MKNGDIDVNNKLTSRREFCRTMALSFAGAFLLPPALHASLKEIKQGEDIFAFINRTKGSFDQTIYRQLIGAANDFKEGDEIIGVAARDAFARSNARRLISNTRTGDILKHPLFEDELYKTMVENLSSKALEKTSTMTIGELKDFLLINDETEIQPLLDGLCSDVIGCLVKIMSNDELIKIGQKIFNPIPGTCIGAKGYMGARIQPNSPTDHPDDVIWQIFSGWSYAVGDVVLGVNPVSSIPESVTQLELTLHELTQTFQIEDFIPHSVLAHIDIQAQVEKKNPDTTGVWFQSLAGSDKGNATFDLSLDKMLNYASQRNGQYGFYFETGQGADFTNGNGQGTDMVIHESRKYGFARLLKLKVAEAQKNSGRTIAPWVHLNDVAGFIGPEVFRTRRQLVRCCLEDIVMGKLHGITIGLDICSTLHMDVSLDDLDWCQDQIMPANPAYLMGLPTKNDPMLGYLTTSFQDHVRLREKFGFKVNDKMWDFFRKMEIIDMEGKPTRHFGEPLWIWYKYRLAKGDTRSMNEIYSEGKQKMSEVRGRGVYLAEGYGNKIWKMNAELEKEIRELYADSKKAIWTELKPSFINTISKVLLLKTCSKDRTDYILHPQSGEVLDKASILKLKALTAKRTEPFYIQIIISDGLNANAIMDKGHLMPYLSSLKEKLKNNNLIPADDLLVISSGRVRVGYRIGELLFGQLQNLNEHRGIIHIIGERPGTMHHTFSAYITAPPASAWQKGNIDHNITRVISGIADTALNPHIAAEETVKIITGLWSNNTI